MAARPDSEEGVASLALSHLDEPGIASLAEDSAGARAARKWFGAARDAVLRRHSWNFATAWDAPAADIAENLGPLKKRFPLKPDCVRVRFVQDLGNDEWAIEGGLATVGGVEVEASILVTNDATPLVCYTRRVEIVRLWDPLFVKAFALELAADMAGELGKGDRAPSLRKSWEEETDAAARSDAQEKAPSEVSRDTSWLRARR